MRGTWYTIRLPHHHLQTAAARGRGGGVCNRRRHAAPHSRHPTRTSSSPLTIRKAHCPPPLADTAAPRPCFNTSVRRPVSYAPLCPAPSRTQVHGTCALHCRRPRCGLAVKAPCTSTHGPSAVCGSTWTAHAGYLGMCATLGSSHAPSHSPCTCTARHTIACSSGGHSHASFVLAHKNTHAYDDMRYVDPPWPARPPTVMI